MDTTDRATFKLVLLRKAADFLRSLPTQARDKMADNIHRIQLGERNVEIFKKLEGSNIYEFRARSAGMSYRLFAFWDKDEETMVIAPRDDKESPKDTATRDSQGRGHKERVFHTKRQMTWKRKRSLYRLTTC